MFYYHIDDPIIEDEEASVKSDNDDPAREKTEEKIKDRLRMSGLVNSDPHVYRLIDNDFETKSSVIPVALKKDGDFASTSCVASAEEFEIISDYVNQQIKKCAQEMLGGNIKAEPRTVSGSYGLPCIYCDYSDVCGYRGDGVLIDKGSITEKIDEDDPAILNGRDPVIEAMRLRIEDEG